MASAGETDGDDKSSQFKFHKSEGKKLLKQGNVQGALQAFERAAEHQADDRLQAKIEKMREFLKSEQAQEGSDSDMVEIGNGFYLCQAIERRLYTYQRTGLLWMWDLYLKKRGGVLGDDMGLGKTIQVIAFLSGMFDSEMIKSVLIIMPVSLIANWKKEFEGWAPGIDVYEYHSGSKKERERNLARVQRRGGVLLTSYGLAQTSHQEFCNRNGEQFVWCYLILDEGHKIKNQTKTTKAIYEIPAKQRLVLTGTAVQNNLQELWALFNFTHQGALVGSLATFKRQYETPINRGREKDATTGENLLGKEIARQLRRLIKPYFLRRTKTETPKKKKNSKDDKAKLTFSSKKNDLVIWIYLSSLQKKIYREFLESDEVANILMTKKSPLVQLTVLKKICDHPRLLSKRACVQMGMYDHMTREEIEELLEKEEGKKISIEDVTDNVLLEESGKMTFVLQLLTILKAEGHRTLFFSQSRKILDIVSRILTNRSFRVARLDGTINKMCERDRIVSQFQAKDSADVFLLTTQVGGVGLTLTAADRVIIYDPSWNPATDAQAVDRAYRIGQQKNVVVYRLITCSTVEEKIYRRQIFKDSIIKQTTGKQNDPMRYFTKQELRELFSLENPNYSGTQVQLSQMHSWDKNSDPALNDHIALLQTKNIFGISHHDLMFSEESREAAKDEFVPGEIERVKERARMAQHLITVESDMALDEIQNKKYFTVPVNNVTKLRPVEHPAWLPKPNVLLSDNEALDKGMSSKWNKALVVPDDDDYNLGENKAQDEGMSSKWNKALVVPDDDDDDNLGENKAQDEGMSSKWNKALVVPDDDDDNLGENKAQDEGMSSKWNKALVVPDDDDDVLIDGVDSLNKSLACMTVQASENKVSILVNDSEEELFPSGEDLDTDEDMRIILDTDEEFSDAPEEVDSSESFKMNKQAPLSTADERVLAKTDGQVENNAGCDVKIVNVEESNVELLVKDEHLMAEGSFEELHVSPNLKLSVQDKHNTREQRKLPSLLGLEEGILSRKATLQDCSDKVAQKSACEEVNKDAIGQSLHTTEQGKRLVKKRLLRSPNQSLLFQTEAKHLQLSPSVLQKEGNGNTRAPPRGLGELQNILPGTAASSPSCPARASFSQPRFHSTPLSTPPKRIAPFFVGSPLQFSPSQCQKMPPSPFQEALAKSVEYAEVDVTPLKVQQASASHSRQTSVHVVSSESEEDASKSSSDDEVVVRRRLTKAFVIMDSDESP
ncbi:DNA excision repair protein ERCC-6-like isoform X2 [Rhipicephalus microplus]|uniref:DNA excision repair protein ERCC-6-like isoform X2 n=1 Tax=Rhipicephalus microplus TaxID=6941 RepID=UPI003F6C9696